MGTYEGVIFSTAGAAGVPDWVNGGWGFASNNSAISSVQVSYINRASKPSGGLHKVGSYIEVYGIKPINK